MGRQGRLARGQGLGAWWRVQCSGVSSAAACLVQRASEADASFVRPAFWSAIPAAAGIMGTESQACPVSGQEHAGEPEGEESQDAAT